jgi:hypothetical protein
MSKQYNKWERYLINNDAIEISGNGGRKYQGKSRKIKNRSII